MDKGDMFFQSRYENLANEFTNDYHGMNLRSLDMKIYQTRLQYSIWEISNTALSANWDMFLWILMLWKIMLRKLKL